MEIPNFKSCLLAILLVAGLLFTNAKPTFADSYQTFLLGPDDHTFFGMDDSGNVALHVTCAGFIDCYDIYHDGTFTGTETTPGIGPNDSGTGCTPAVPPGGRVLFGVCNNGRDAFTGLISSTQVIPNVYVGSYPDITQVGGGGGSAIHMNSRGDILYDNGLDDNWYFLLDTTTSAVPEPGSILFLATGAAAAIVAMRRRSRATTLKSWFLATLTLASAFAASKPVFADTYQTFLLWSDNVQFYGMDDSGAVVLDFSQECSTGSCYRIFINGLAVGGLLNSPPSLNYDNGTPCTPALPPGAHLGEGVCNNGREAFTGVLSPDHPLGGVFVGSYPDLTQLLPGGCCGSIYMNAQGDIVYDDVFSDYWYFAQDITTSTVPEPGSIILVGTGVLGALSMIRRWVNR